MVPLHSREVSREARTSWYLGWPSRSSRSTSHQKRFFVSQSKDTRNEDEPVAISLPKNIRVVHIVDSSPRPTSLLGIFHASVN